MTSKITKGEDLMDNSGLNETKSGSKVLLPKENARSSATAPSCQLDIDDVDDIKLSDLPENYFDDLLDLNFDADTEPVEKEEVKPQPKRPEKVVDNEVTAVPILREKSPECVIKREPIRIVINNKSLSAKKWIRHSAPATKPTDPQKDAVDFPFRQKHLEEIPLPLSGPVLGKPSPSSKSHGDASHLTETSLFNASLIEDPSLNCLQDALPTGTHQQLMEPNSKEKNLASECEACVDHKSVLERAWQFAEAEESLVVKRHMLRLLGFIKDGGRKGPYFQKYDSVDNPFLLTPEPKKNTEKPEVTVKTDVCQKIQFADAETLKPYEKVENVAPDTSKFLRNIVARVLAEGGDQKGPAQCKLDKPPAPTVLTVKSSNAREVPPPPAIGRRWDGYSPGYYEGRPVVAQGTSYNVKKRHGGFGFFGPSASAPLQPLWPPDL